MAESVIPPKNADTKTEIGADINSDINAIEMIEQAFSLLRKIPAQTIFPYYLGTMPFCLGLLYYFNDMSKNAFAHEYCLSASFGLSALYVWMKTWQSMFSTRMAVHLGGCTDRKPIFSAAVFRVITQSILHTSALIVLPVAFVVSIPFAWCAALYQMALVQDPELERSLRTMFKQRLHIARQFTFLNHMVICILSLFGLFIFLNIAVTIYALPFLMKSLFGIESSLTLGGFNPLNTTFIFSAVCITHLLVDPLVKATYVIQYCHFQSRKTGNDLMSGFELIQSSTRKAVQKTAQTTIPTIILICSCLLLPQSAEAEHSPGAAAPEASFAATSLSNGISPADHGEKAPQITAQDLEKAIAAVMKKREYTWRLPAETIDKKQNEPGFFIKALKWVAGKIKTGVETIFQWIEAVIKKLSAIFKKDKAPDREPAQSRLTPSHLAAGLIVLVVILLFAIGIHLRKQHRKKAEKKTDSQDSTALPDIRNEDILADMLPGEQWMTLAADLRAKGEFRLAIRAVYLSVLALLADKELVRIAGHKSNLDYQRELALRAHTRETVLEDFGQLAQNVDRVWYGMHQAGSELYDQFLSTRKRIIHAD